MARNKQKRRQLEVNQKVTTSTKENSTKDNSKGSSSARHLTKKTKRSHAASSQNDDPESSISVRYGGTSNRCDQDTLALLTIFPEEIWILISQHLDDDSMEKLNNASQFFRNVFMKKRVNFLFPMVWNILAPKYHQQEIYQQHLRYYDCRRYTDSRDERQEHFSSCWHDRILPGSRQCGVSSRRIQTYWFSELLNLRLVCRQWRNGVDAFYQNLPYHFINELDSRDHFVQSNQWTCNVFDFVADRPGRPVTTQSYEYFEQHFKDTHENSGEIQRNPFLGRSVIIKKFNDGMVNLLKNYGQHIWYCSAKFDRKAQAAHYMELRTLLQELPNIKELCLNGGQYFYWRQTIKSVRITKTCRSKPFPTLANLQFLKFDSLPTAILDEVLCRNNHVSTLEFENQNYEMIYYIQLPNLKSLSIPIHSDSMLERLEQGLMNIPLEKINLKFKVEEPGEIKWTRIFRVLESKWGETLTDVTLNLEKTSKYRVVEYCSTLRLYLPRVKRFEVSMDCISSLDFILPMSNSLERLQFNHLSNILVADRRNAYYRSVVKSQIIEFLDYEYLMLKSNIWSLFPKLQQFVLENCSESDRPGPPGHNVLSYTRREWQNAKDMNQTEAE